MRQYITTVNSSETGDILAVFLFNVENDDDRKPVEPSKDVARGICDHIRQDVEFTIYDMFTNSSPTRTFHGAVSLPWKCEVNGVKYNVRRIQ